MTHCPESGSPGKPVEPITLESLLLPVFLTLSVLLLAAGFYLVYFRKPTCEPGDGCALPNPRLTRSNKVMLWVATLFVATIALFPNYVGVLLGTGAAPSWRLPTTLSLPWRA